jgi:hypothetical protein
MRRSGRAGPIVSIPAGHDRRLRPGRRDAGGETARRQHRHHGLLHARFWISDYTFSAIFSYRVSHPSASIAPVPSLVVWGAENDVPTLEPAFEVTTSPSLPPTRGHSIEGRDAAGKTVFSLSFAAERMLYVADDVRHFAFAGRFPRRSRSDRAPSGRSRSGIDTACTGDQAVFSTPTASAYTLRQLPPSTR